MTLAQLLTDLNARIGSTPEVSNANMTTWLNEGMRVFCEEYPFYWLEKRVTTSSIENQSEYNLPSDFKQIIELSMDQTDENPNIYVYKPYQQRFGTVSSEQTVSVVGNVMRITPTPDTTGDNNINLTYIMRPANMTSQGDSPSDSTIANMPEVYHPALVQYAFAIYNAYDEEQAEFQAIMGNKLNPIPGTYYYYVNLARKEDESRKMGTRRKMLTKQYATGYTRPNQLGLVSQVLKV